MVTSPHVFKYILFNAQNRFYYDVRAAYRGCIFRIKCHNLNVPMSIIKDTKGLLLLIIFWNVDTFTRDSCHENSLKVLQ